MIAANAKTGEVLWTRDESGQPISNLAVVDGRIYAGFLTGHVLRAYDASTGNLLWSTPGPTFTPTVVGGVVYASDDFGKLWALDAATGRRRWVVHIHSGGYGFGLALSQGRIYVGGHDADGNSPIYAYDASTGALVWKAPTKASADRTPAVADGVVFAGSDRFYALDAETGLRRWTAPVVTTDSPTVAQGVVYIAAYVGTLYAYDTATGDRLWATPVGSAFVSDPVVANGLVFIGSIDDVLHAFDASTGTELWSYDTGDTGHVDGQVVVNGTVYMSRFEGTLYAFRLPGA
jgi:outer membrane protein assembly factor BamB